MLEALHQQLSFIGVQLSNDALLILLCLTSCLFGWLLCKYLFQRKLEVQQQLFNLQTEKKQDEFDQQLDLLQGSFSTLSQQALQQNNQSFLSLAKESFGKLQIQAESQLKQKEVSFAHLVKPIQETLAKTDAQLQRLEKDRVSSESKLTTQIEGLLQSQQFLQTETRNLVTALRRPEVRGQWGELTLKRLAELAGLSEHCDFDEQVTTLSSDSLLRPDMVVNMPGNRQLVVDVKAPLDAYLSAIEANSDMQRDTHLTQHLKNVKGRIKELAMKKYWEQFEQAPDFVVLFIPGDQFLSAALDQDKSLLEYAMQQRVILATPTSLVGLLRAIAYGWNQENLNQNAEVVRKIGQDLHHRLGTLSEHMAKLGKSLDSSVSTFNKLLGSYENNVLPGAKKFTELGIDSHKNIDQTKTIETSARKTTKTIAETHNKD
ncbi:MAG: DNA recombination protein RmuC [Arenicella sp.]